MHANTSESALATPNTGERLIRLPEVLHAVSLGRSAWLERVKERKAPQPVKIGTASFWVHSEIQAFIADSIRQSRTGACE
jgi:predicted DNA-binding transcriptional regulator AlpA